MNVLCLGVRGGHQHEQIIAQPREKTNSEKSNRDRWECHGHIPERGCAYKVKVTDRSKRATIIGKQRNSSHGKEKKNNTLY